MEHAGILCKSFIFSSCYHPPVDVDDSTLLTLLHRDPETLREKVIAEEIDEGRVLRAGKRFAENGQYHDAVECFAWLSDDGGLRHVARIALDNRDFDGAQHAVERIENSTPDDMALLESVAEHMDTMSRTYDIVEHNSSRVQAVKKVYVRWCEEHGFDDVYFPAEVLPSVAAMVRDLSEEFEVVVGVPRGGLLLAFAFDVFGCDVGLVEYHRDTEDPPVWVRDVDVQDEHVLVVDNDVRSGDTLAAVANALDDATALNIAFLWDEKGGLGSLLSNVPDEYHSVFLPGEFDEYMDGFNALERCL